MTFPSVIVCAQHALRQQGTRSMVMVLPTLTGTLNRTDLDYLTPPHDRSS